MTISRILNVALLSTLCFSQNPSPQNETNRRIHEYLDRATDSEFFSGTVAVAKDGKIAFSRGYGMADLDFDVSNAPQTRFDIGSVSKPFTATLALWLQDRGSIRVEDPVCKYLDNFPDVWRPVTIRYLLTHTPQAFSTTSKSLTILKKVPLERSLFS